MSTLRVLCRDQPRRTIALATNKSVLLLSHTSTTIDPSRGASNHGDVPRCLVDFSSLSSVDLRDYRLLGEGYGTLGLITLNNDVFICVVTASSRAATVRPGETILRIDNVEFYCLNRSDYEHSEDYQLASRFATEEINHDGIYDNKDIVTDHPFLALKRLLNDGSFYYSPDFNLTDRLQNRYNDSGTFDIDSLDEDMLWNSYMIRPLLLFRRRLTTHERANLDSSHILTSVIRGFAGTLTIPASISLLPQLRSNLPSNITVISRLSSRRAGTRFNSRGIDDDGNVSNFVETETVLWIPPGITFSYTQARGSVPIFWEQTAGLLPGQQKIEIARSFEATQHAFDKHFETLELKYGAVHIINLLSETKPGESELSARFREHVARRSLRQQNDATSQVRHHLLKTTEFDFHAETRGPLGYEGSSQIRHIIEHSLDGFAYFLSDEGVGPQTSKSDEKCKEKGSTVILQQEGIFRTNCLDCLDRTNLVQTIISQMALESFLFQQGGHMVPDLQMRHSSLWADNGDALSKIYAGTGALKSSFTRHGKMSLAGAFADVRKSATRLYVNTFADKARQNTIDILLGRLANQVSVDLYDPINDMVTAELNRRVAEYTSVRNIRIWAGTFNLNGRSEGATADLSPWLLALREEDGEDPTIVAVAFQEIVELSPQQIMSTDPKPRLVWEEAVKRCLNSYSERFKRSKYVLLRSGQLVGAALLIYIRADALGDVKNVEGSVKKTGLSGMAGNKGGCAIRLELSNTKLCFVTAHLAAGFANYDERNRDYATISHGLRFQKNKSIEDHDAIIWLGDFNYRIGLSDQKVRELIQKKQYDKLYENDQLNLQMIAGRTFQFYSEGRIGFPPTYKYNIGTDEYDTSEKARIPAWCDRILWKGANLRQRHYRTADLKFSDHRPVFALFDCTISIVDEQTKDRLSRVLYDKHRREIGDLTLKFTVEDSEDEELIGYRSIAPGFPPASSDRHKWWLDQGSHVRSTIKPPEHGQIPNIYRKSNPFSPSAEPDWITLQQSSEENGGQDFNRSSLPVKTPPKPPVPRRLAKSSTIQTTPLESDTQTKQNSSNDRSVSSQKPGDLNPRELPPPIPRKPVSLSLQMNSNKSDISSEFRNHDTRNHHERLEETHTYRPPLPARVNSKPASSSPNERLECQPWRKGTGLESPNEMEVNKTSHLPGGHEGPLRNFLDDGADEAMKDWKPLIPRRGTD
ncbi:hypothetical protein VTN96DRAFT_9783 [Rasamsonia emersonii]